MTKRDDVALWKALKQAEIDDDLEEIEGMTDAELDAYIAANGGDPAAIRAAGRAAADEALARRERLGWQGDMQKRIEAFRAKAEAKKTKTVLPRTELLARLNAARNSPRFAAPVAALFHKKTFEASTDEELQALLDSIDLLVEAAESEKH